MKYSLDPRDTQDGRIKLTSNSITSCGNSYVINVIIILPENGENQS